MFHIMIQDIEAIVLPSLKIDAINSRSCLVYSKIWGISLLCIDVRHVLTAGG